MPSPSNKTTELGIVVFSIEELFVVTLDTARAYVGLFAPS
jgi:hypothetical protein